MKNSTASRGELWPWIYGLWFWALWWSNLQVARKRSNDTKNNHVVCKEVKQRSFPQPKLCVGKLKNVSFFPFGWKFSGFSFPEIQKSLHYFETATTNRYCYDIHLNSEVLINCLCIFYIITDVLDCSEFRSVL